MSGESVPVWRRIVLCCWSIFGYFAIFSKVGQSPRPTTEDETRSLPGSAEQGGSDQTVIDVKPEASELSGEKGAVLGGGSSPVDGKPRVSQSLTDGDELWI